MRKIAIAALSAAAALSLGACSQKTQDNAAKTAESAGEDTQTNAAVVGNAAERGANAVGTAAKNAGAAAEQERAETEARIQHESVEKAKRD